MNFANHAKMVPKKIRGDGMATVAQAEPKIRGNDRFFFVMAIVMALVIVTGFSLNIAMGRSSFASPVRVHAHAVIFMGWVALYLAQNYFVVAGRRDLHRALGWIGMAWIVAMIAAGSVVTIMMVRNAEVPFFFTPAYFLVMDELTVLSFAALTVAAVVLRRATEWHRRLHYCGMAILTGPALGRLLPMPFLIPHAGLWVFGTLMLFPAIGILADLRRAGRVHPAWWWGCGAMALMMLLMEVIGNGPLGAAIYAQATAGSPGAAVPGQAYPPLPAWMH